MNVTVIDLEFQGVKNVIAAYLVEAKNTCLLVETGPSSSFAALDAGLQKKGRSLSEVTDVLLSHIHFDHAGAAWKFASLGATIHVHPFGKKHLNDPTRLWNSAAQIYGSEGMEMLWGEMQGISEQLLSTWEHQETRTIGSVVVKSLHTPGHAKHHIAWCIEHAIFTGDVGGVKIGSGPLEPPCPPPDIDLDAWLVSIETMLAHNQKRRKQTNLYLTHFGKTQLSTESHLLELKDNIQKWGKKAQSLLESDPTSFEMQMTGYIETQRSSNGSNNSDAYALANPASMSAPGLKRFLSKKRNLD